MLHLAEGQRSRDSSALMIPTRSGENVQIKRSSALPVAAEAFDPATPLSQFQAFRIINILENGCQVQQSFADNPGGLERLRG